MDGDVASSPLAVDLWLRDSEKRLRRGRYFVWFLFIVSVVGTLKELSADPDEVFGPSFGATPAARRLPVWFAFSAVAGLALLFSGYMVYFLPLMMLSLGSFHLAGAFLGWCRRKGDSWGPTRGTVPCAAPTATLH